MDMLLQILPPDLLLAAFAVALLAGVVKGIVGFAMPMILLSGLSMFMSPELALAALLLPTVVTNGMQILRHGLRAVWQVTVRFRIFLMVGGAMLFGAAQLVPQLPVQLFLLALGVVVTGFALWQLSGLAPAPGAWQQSRKLDITVGAFAGFVGGISGIWGPPTVAYLTAMGTEKRAQMLAQGVIYGLGAVLLVIGHLRSGILNAQTLPLSVLLVVPAIAGMMLGGRISDRFDQATFRKVTLIVMTLGGLNLLRRGIFG